MPVGISNAESAGRAQSEHCTGVQDKDKKGMVGIDICIS